MRATTSCTCRRSRRARTTLVVVVLAALLLVPLGASPYQNSQLTLVFTWAIALIGLNIVTGYGGLTSLAQGTFVGIGAYTSAILIHHGWAPAATIPVAAALTFVLGFVVGMPALRVKGLYLALVTLSVGLLFGPVVKRLQGITGGDQGLTVPTLQAPGWSGLAADQWTYYVALAVGAVMLAFAANLMRSHVGRAIVAMRDGEPAASAMGVSLFRYKTLLFAYSSMFAGVAGSLYTFQIGVVTPESFELLISVFLLAAMVVGGASSLLGSVIGGVVYVYLPNYASQVSQALAGVVYGAAILVVMLTVPSGISGLLTGAWTRVVALVGRRRRLLAECPVHGDGAASVPHAT